jgi:hypothetical protein
LTNGEPDDDGGFDELVEFMPNRRFSSAFSASSAAGRARSSAITPRLLDDPSGKLVTRPTPNPGLHQSIVPGGRSSPHGTSYPGAWCNGRNP